MFRRIVSVDDLARLKREREEADRRYNEALTALDAASQRVPDMPHPPPPADDFQISPLNDLYRVIPGEGPDLGAGWRARLRGMVWRLVGPMLERQQAFNAALVDHVNRNWPAAREVNRGLGTTITVLTHHIEGVVAVQSKLIQYLQQITPYVDTKDYEFQGLARRADEDNRELILWLRDRADNLDGSVRNLERDLTLRGEALAGAIGGVSDEMLKRWESMVARERRYEARVDEVRTSLSLVQQASQVLKRELDRLLAAPPTGAGPGPAAPRPVARADASEAPGGASVAREAESVARGSSPATLASQQLAGGLDSYKYVGFEDQFRGSVEDIRARQATYVELFDGAAEVLDVGCGRGEFLELLRERGITARGVDINREMVETCRAKGLDVSEGDVLGYLRELPDAALGGLIAAQVVEHLEPGYLMRVLETAYHKLRPGSKIVLETINPTCWVAFFESYIRDITHVRPIHPDTLKYLVLASGFQRATVQFSAPYPDASKLQPISLRPDDQAVPQPIRALAGTFNDNVDKINRLLFTYLDYAVIAERL